MIDKQFYFFGQETVVVVEHVKYYYLFFLKKRLLLLKKHFETGMIMLPKNIFSLCHSTVHAAHININNKAQ